MNWRDARSRLGPLLLAGTGVAAFWGCTGDLGDVTDPGVSQSALCTGALSPGEAPIRRLTGVEYDNTVRDLLGDESNQAHAFVPEEEALGFDNQATALTASRLLSEQYMVAAENIAHAAVTDRLAEILPCDPAADGEAECGRAFVATFGARAFRRPLDIHERDRLVGVFDWGRESYDFAAGIALVIETVLQSSHFLYRVEFGMPDPVEADVVALGPYELATRLSYLVYNSMPDEELFAAAERGELATPEQIAAQARRMLGDDKARTAVQNFHEQWLGLRTLTSIHKDPVAYPMYSDDLRPLWKAETMAFVNYVIFEDGGSLQTLLTAPYSLVNSQLASFYGIEEGASSSALERVELDPDQRAGLLTHASVLAAYAKPDQSSPIHRGKFVREKLLCELLPPPPNDVDIVLPELDPELTTRERFAQHSSDPACSGCHTLIDPIGFGFENYDGVGLWRAEENGKVIDASGEIVGTGESDLWGPFVGVVELADRLAASEEVRSCVATQWFRFGYGRGEQPEDACSMETVRAAFAASGYDIRELIVALTLTDAFRYRHAVNPS